MSTDLEMIDLTEIVGEVPISCDYSQYDWCPKGEAKWAARLKCPGCRWTGLRLICECKDFLVVTQNAMECTGCGTVIAPARRAFSSIEPIDRKTA